MSLRYLLPVALAIILAPLSSLRAQGGATPAPHDTSTDTTTSTVAGVIRDSTTGKPLAGAVVQLVSRTHSATAYGATTDSTGAFRLTGVRHGSYLAGFLHPRLDSLGISQPLWAINVQRDSLIDITLAIPSPTSIRQQLCHTANPNDSTGLVSGFVRDADTGNPLPGSSVILMWAELVIDHGIHQDRRQVPVKTNTEGWYAICGVPSDGSITARAELGSRASGYVELDVAPRSLLHRDFGIPSDSTAVAVADTAAAKRGEQIRHGSARLTGIVRDERGKPLSGAQVLVWGSGLSATTTDDGTFALAQLPAGTQTLEARYIGYMPKRLTVDLASKQITSASITMNERISTLGAVTVYGKRTRDDITGFLERQRRGFGHFITADEIDRQHPLQFTDLLYTVPGVRVTPTQGFGYAILMRGGCQPAIYLDGMQVTPLAGMGSYAPPLDINSLVPPQDITGIEIYNGPSEAPIEYQGNDCGSVLIWTGPRRPATAKAKSEKKVSNK